MRKNRSILILIVLALAAPAFAILGLGDIVFDPTNYEEAIQQFAQLQQQYEQLVRTYQTVESQYQQMLRMAQTLPQQAMLRYLTPSTAWIPASAADAYGNTAGWTGVVNSGAGARSAYSTATETLGDYGSAFGSIPPDQTTAIKAGYATIELQDGANLVALQTIGEARGGAATTEAAIRNLESDSLSADPALNTEVGVLNKINAGAVIQLRASQNANQLLVTLAESQVIASKRQRDAATRAFNQHIAFVHDGRAELVAQASRASDAMLNWRMP